MKSNLTIEQVRKALGLDPVTGILVWLAPQSNRVKIGARAGVVAQNGRRYINVAGEKHLAHRLVWFHYHGEWPTGDVRQKNGNYDDCSVTNLIEQSRQEVASTRRVNAKSRSGHAGVTWDSRRQRWQVHITRDYKQVGVGSYDRLEDAVAARKEAVATAAVNVSAEDKTHAAHAVARRRRQRMAWQRLERSGYRVAWISLDEFCRDIGDIPETQMALLPLDLSAPIGPKNWKWSLPTEDKHDFRTPEGRRAYSRAHRLANVDLYRDKELRKRFGITLVQYREKLAEQGGVCAICGTDEIAERQGKPLALAVDHDHDTNKLRGLLCIACNTGIGKLRDNPGLVQAAADYLVSHGRAFVPPMDEFAVATLGFGA